MLTGALVGRKKNTSTGGKNKKPQANVKLAADLVHKLGVISQWRQKSISVIIDPQLRPFVDAEFERVAKEMSQAAEQVKQQQGPGDS